jgi:hypothetical protein
MDSKGIPIRKFVGNFNLAWNSHFGDFACPKLFSNTQRYKII